MGYNPMDQDARLSEIGRRAADLCYRDRGACQDNICIGSCMAVCPGKNFLIAASEQIFDEYWMAHPLKLTPASTRSDGEAEK